MTTCSSIAAPPINNPPPPGPTLGVESVDITITIPVVTPILSLKLCDDHKSPFIGNITFLTSCRNVRSPPFKLVVVSNNASIRPAFHIIPSILSI